MTPTATRLPEQADRTTAAGLPGQLSSRLAPYAVDPMPRLETWKKQAKLLVRGHREGNFSIGGRIRQDPAVTP